MFGSRTCWNCLFSQYLQSARIRWEHISQQTAGREEVLPQLLGCHQEALKVHSWHFWQFFSARSNLCHLVVASPSPTYIHPLTLPAWETRKAWGGLCELCERVMRIRASEQDQIRWLASRGWGGGAFLGGRQRFQREELSLEKKEQNWNNGYLRGPGPAQ